MSHEKIPRRCGCNHSRRATSRKQSYLKSQWLLTRLHGKNGISSTTESGFSTEQVKTLSQLGFLKILNRIYIYFLM
ncbi:hypothetical protein B9Z55_007615 [Caenorhabditis nigoni]|uniref:Uncharacterized protein n=1 Tax=Caenorhabditis nigoni TaxID=1611254 RepID=A0A2G5VAR6_9PELO|nr:hypothetical protein B9Z55_007615 [Caenorhabditis nigoni]